MLQFPSNENGKTASIKMLSLTFRVSTLLSITHLDWGSGKVWQLFDVLTLFSNDGAHCKCRNEQVNSLRFWVSLLDINSLVLLRLGEDRMHRPPPPRTFAQLSNTNAQMPTVDLVEAVKLIKCHRRLHPLLEITGWSEEACLPPQQ